MRRSIFFLACVLLAACANDSLKHRKYFDTPSMASPEIPTIESASCIVKALNFLDTCATKYVSELYIDTTRRSLRDRIHDVRQRQPDFSESIQEKIRIFYEENSLKTEWLELDAPIEQFYAFADEVRRAATFGLNPDHYSTDELKQEIQRLYMNPKRTQQEVTALDMRITGNFFIFTTHLIEGRIPPGGNEEFIWRKNAPRQNDIKLLLDIKTKKQLKKELARLHPVHPQYKQLREAFLEYKALAAEADRKQASEISFEGSISPGERHEAVPVIRKRLQLTDLKGNGKVTDSLRYDRKLVSAVTRFQRRHGLLSDGIVGPNTLKNLNISFRRKADIIALNLERLRWLPNRFPDEYISINIPEYKLRVYDRKKEVLSMPVVLGAVYTSTPVFSADLKYLVFSPTWTVPYSIIEDEIIPQLREDSSYYTGRNYKFYKHGEEIDPAEEDWSGDALNVYNYKVVQQPGPSNALGRVKFIMPNNMYIYLHDTPADHLFNRNTRALSHGCIRVEKPLALADHLLRKNKSWTTTRIINAMAAASPDTVYLQDPVRVQINYHTAWVDRKDGVHFREDIYGHDARQLNELRELLPPTAQVVD